MTVPLFWLTAITIAYPLAVMNRLQQVPESLSATCSALGDRGWIYRAVFGATAILLLYIHGSNLLMILSCSSLIVAITQTHGRVHNTAGIMACTAAGIWTATSSTATLAAVGLAAFICWIWSGKWIWWTELGVMYSVIIQTWRVMLN